MKGNLSVKGTKRTRRFTKGFASFALYFATFALKFLLAAAFSQQTTTLANLLERVESHPELAMKRASIEAAEARIPARSSLLEPKLVAGVQNVPTKSFGFRDDPMTSKVIGIEQMLPYPGKLGKERTIGEYEVDIAEASFAETRNILRRDVKLAYYDIQHRQRAISVNLRHVRLLEDFKKEVAVSVAYGKSSISQLDQLELEQTGIEQMIAEDSSMTAMRKAKLQYVTGAEVGRLAPGDSGVLAPFAASLDRLMDEARASSPKLAAIRADILGAIAAIERAKLERYPDFGLMLMYMQRSDLAAPNPAMGSTRQSDMVSAQVSISLPFVNYGGSKDALVAEAEAMRAMKLAEQEQTEREIRMMLAERLARIEELRRKHELYQSSVFPSIESRIRTFMAEYQFDKTSLQSTITQIINFLHKQHEVFEIESEYQQTIAEIEYIIGADVR